MTSDIIADDAVAGISLEELRRLGEQTRDSPGCVAANRVARPRMVASAMLDAVYQADPDAAYLTAVQVAVSNLAREVMGMRPAEDEIAERLVRRVSRPQPAAAASADPVPALRPQSARDIDEADLPEVDFVIPGIVAVGGALLGARPKEGKTYMMIDWGVAVASGGRAMDSIRCRQGDALLLLLEDNAARFRRRMRQLLGERPKPERLAVQFMDGDVRRIDTGLPDQIRGWCRSVAEPRLVVIDCLTAVKPVGFDKRAVFLAEYEMVRTINDLAHELGVAIVIVHHLRKMKSDGDPIDELSGTYGLAAAVDTVVGLRKNGSGGYELRGRGRDVEEFELGLVRGDGRWTAVGSAEELRLSGERRKALAVLRETGRPMTAAEVGKETGQKADAARKMLDRMAKDGDGVERNAGRYRAKPDQGEMPLGDGSPAEVQGEEEPVM